MSRTARWLGGVALAAAFLWSAWATEVSLGRVIEGVPFMLDFIRRMLPPDPSVLGQALKGALQTLQISVVGTAVGALLALPVSFAAARNTSGAGLPRATWVPETTASKKGPSLSAVRLAWITRSSAEEASASRYPKARTRSSTSGTPGIGIGPSSICASMPSM